jgi:hypothetical protein
MVSKQVKCLVPCPFGSDAGPLALAGGMDGRGAGTTGFAGEPIREVSIDNMFDQQRPSRD